MYRYPLSTALLLLSMMVLSTGCDAVIDAALNESEKISFKERDKQLDAALKGPNSDGETLVPMSEFFGNTQKYKLWAGDAESFKSLGENCTAAGAIGAYAVVFQEDEMQVSDTFAFALPTDKAVRAKVFEAYNQFWKEKFPLPPPLEIKRRTKKWQA